MGKRGCATVLTSKRSVGVEPEMKFIVPILLRDEEIQFDFDIQSRRYHPKDITPKISPQKRSKY